jgi:hypothetical protein
LGISSKGAADVEFDGQFYVLRVGAKVASDRPAVEAGLSGRTVADKSQHTKQRHRLAAKAQRAWDQRGRLGEFDHA